MHLPRDLSRRDVVKGSGALGALWLLSGAGLGAAGLAGCATSKSADLPDPVGVGSAPQPILSRPVAPPVQAYYPPPTPQPYSPPAPAFPSGSATVLTRNQWTSKGVARPRDINPMNGVSRITVHHDGMNVFTATGQSSAAARLEQIRAAHVNGRGWADIGYHYIIDPGGRVWEGRGVQYQGAHVQDQNEHNLGVMCMGNFDQQSPSSAQLATLDAFLAQMMSRYAVPVSRVKTHQELDRTACPGRNLQRYMVQTRARGGRLALAAVAALGGAIA